MVEQSTKEDIARLEKSTKEDIRILENEINELRKEDLCVEVKIKVPIRDIM